MKEFLTDMLIDPTTGTALQYNAARNIFQTNDGDNYEILEDVPVILPKQKSLVSSIFNKHLKGHFNYAEHYQKDAEVYNYFKQEKSKATKNEVVRLHQTIVNIVPKNARLILDVGCGNGWLAKYFTKRNKKVISMDISTVNPIRALKENPNENHAALVADVFNLPIKNNLVDCIVASEIIEHVPDPKLFVDKLIEKLKPRGKLIITTPYDEKIEYYLCVHCNLPTPKNAHLHSFNKKNIIELIPGKTSGWRVKSFANKYLIRTGLNLLLSFLPFSLWKFIDRFANTIFSSPTRFIIEIIKK